MTSTVEALVECASTWLHERNELMRQISHPPNVMPEELQRAHYIMQIVKLRELNAELLASLIDIHEDLGGCSCSRCQKRTELIAKAEKLK